mmetsp:Transcript_2273/g.6797  ORF Transcript_2273/g.6797 Transcript_2273/m.6797 type:complete len:276 (-) Transcript_2273:665-1492(-)
MARSVAWGSSSTAMATGTRASLQRISTTASVSTPLPMGVCTRGSGRTTNTRGWEWRPLPLEALITVATRKGSATAGVPAPSPMATTMRGSGRAGHGTGAACSSAPTTVPMSATTRTASVTGTDASPGALATATSASSPATGPTGWVCTCSSLARCTRGSGVKAASMVGASSACTTGSSGRGVGRRGGRSGCRTRRPPIRRPAAAQPAQPPTSRRRWPPPPRPAAPAPRAPPASRSTGSPRVSCRGPSGAPCTRQWLPRRLRRRCKKPPCAPSAPQ